jgi:hypothetical protein
MEEGSWASENLTQVVALWKKKKYYKVVSIELMHF